jgi:cytochrome c oxidase cbb3-type subunit 1
MSVRKAELPLVDTEDTRKRDETQRMQIDASSASPTVVFLASGIFWLLVGSVLGAVASVKFHVPEWLGASAPFTFGRIRPVHLNMVAYGWVSMGGAGIVTWLMGRLTRTEIRWPGLLYASALLWNIGLVAGSVLILLGYSGGMEWLEFPLPVAVVIALAFVLFAVSMFRTFADRKVEHVYVSLWYILASLVWFPFLYVIANSGAYQGVGEAAMNWWYGHNAIAVWFTPIGLASVYYFIPKVIGRPIYSYYLGLLGFWSFALFYNWNGLHHLVGGPLPTWAISISIVASLLMFIPVMAVAVNHHLTAFTHLKIVRYSPTLRFVVFGAMSYTAVSFQGSLEATRSMSEVVHFTHYTIGHAHLGMYAFVSMVMFGAVYYILPRIAKWEWPYPNLIKIHFWLSAIGVVIYFVFMTIGGWLQGRDMNDATIPFIDTVQAAVPYLVARSVGGIMMTVGHFIFAYHVALVIYRSGPRRFAPAWFRKAEEVAGL